VWEDVGLQDLPDPPGLLDTEETLDPSVFQVDQASRDQEEHRGPRDLLGQLDHKARQDSLVYQVHRVSQEAREREDSLEEWELPEPQDMEAGKLKTQDPGAQQEFQALVWAALELQETQVAPEQQDPQGCKVCWDLLDHLDHQDQSEQQDQEADLEVLDHQEHREDQERLGLEDQKDREVPSLTGSEPQEQQVLQGQLEELVVRKVLKDTLDNQA